MQTTKIELKELVFFARHGFLAEEATLGQRFNLIEAAADAMAAAILERFDKVQSVTVKVKKPSVPVDCVCEYFAAEVTRCR